MSAAEQLDAPPFAIRFAQDSDRNPILSSWLSSFINAEPSWVRHVPRELAFLEHDKLLKHILERPATLALVAHDPEHEDHVMSWLVGELRTGELVLHYGYTFNFARRGGCFRALLTKLLAERGDRALVYTHRARWAKTIGPKIGATFNPYRIFQ